jgi:pimeloyl-ACP methyl ester carboxylesterase
MEREAIEPLIEGDGAHSVVMIHGWPDTLRLWDGTVQALKPHYRCVRFTLPGFDRARSRRAFSLDEVVATIHRIVSDHCAGQRVTLLVHDWGCLYGYQFALRHPEQVERIVGVDIGDAGSAAHQAELGLKAKLSVLAYQLWLATAWRLGGTLGDRMARGIARALRCPVDAQQIDAAMGYPYAVQWFGVRGGFGKVRPFDPQVPMQYLYGQRKPFMFHSRAWADALQQRPGSRVLGLRAGHWVMVDQPQRFHDELLRWLAETATAG